MPTIKSAKLAATAAIAAGGLTLATGLAAAGVLPDNADDTAKDKVEAVEQVSTQKPDTDTETETEAVETENETDEQKVSAENTAEPNGEHGAAVVAAVQAADAEGGKGEEVSAVATQWGEQQREAHAQNDTAEAGSNSQAGTKGASAEHRSNDDE